MKVFSVNVKEAKYPHPELEGTLTGLYILWCLLGINTEIQCFSMDQMLQEMTLPCDFGKTSGNTFNNVLESLVI